jgi:hypothetical protein
LALSAHALLSELFELAGLEVDLTRTVLAEAGAAVVAAVVEVAAVEVALAVAAGSCRAGWDSVRPPKDTVKDGELLASMSSLHGMDSHLGMT